MGGNQEDSHNRGRRRSLNKRILTNTTLNILVLVIICCVIMAFSMQSLANSILLDSLQPMARQSAKTVEANIHMMAERMMDIAGDPRMEASSSFDGQAGGAGFGGTTALGDREAVLTEAAEIYELHTIALYDLEGRLVQAAGSAPKNLDGSFFALLQETDNLPRIPRNRFLRFASIGYSGSVPEINDFLVGNLPHNLPRHRQSAHPGIEDSYRRFGHCFFIRH